MIKNDKNEKSKNKCIMAFIYFSIFLISIFLMNEKNNLNNTLKVMIHSPSEPAV